jgi:hypothetical protein
MSKGTRGGSTNALEAAKAANSMAMSVFNCPSRRTAPLSPAVLTSLSSIINCAKINIGTDVLFHGDYKANAGSVKIPWGTGPNSWAEAEAGIGFKTSVRTGSNGICFQRSAITVRLIFGGTSHIYLAGEKYLNPDNYLNGKDLSDDQPFLGSDDSNLYGWVATGIVPTRDRRGVTSEAFGSNHPYTFNMAFCDGSANSVAFDVDLDTLMRTANRYVDKTPAIIPD